MKDLRLRDDALGVEALTVDELKLQKSWSRLKELYQTDPPPRSAAAARQAHDHDGGLLKSAPKYNPKVRADYEVARRASRDYLTGRNGTAIPFGISLADAQVADLNP